MHAADEASTNSTRTARASARERSEAMLDGNGEFAPLPRVDDAQIAEVRREYAAEAEPLGTRDGPATLLDKLGARLCFERAGVRLYQALIAKHDVFGSFAGGPSRAELEDLMETEHAHFLLLAAAMDERSADPGALTPASALEEAACSGVRGLLLDPRVDFARSLEAMLIAELADAEGWRALVELAAQSGEEGLAARFRAVHDEEREHVRRIRGWLSAFRSGG